MLIDLQLAASRRGLPVDITLRITVRYSRTPAIMKGSLTIQRRTCAIAELAEMLMPFATLPFVFHLGKRLSVRITSHCKSDGYKVKRSRITSGALFIGAIRSRCIDSLF